MSDYMLGCKWHFCQENSCSLLISLILMAFLTFAVARGRRGASYPVRDNLFLGPTDPYPTYGEILNLGQNHGADLPAQLSLPLPL